MRSNYIFLVPRYDCPFPPPFDGLFAPPIWLSFERTLALAGTCNVLQASTVIRLCRSSCRDLNRTRMLHKEGTAGGVSGVQLSGRINNSSAGRLSFGGCTVVILVLLPRRVLAPTNARPYSNSQ
jgi:hypothetical protein